MGDLSGRKAVGPDGYLADVFRFLPALFPVINVLFNAIIVSGVILKPILAIHIVPPDKPKGGPTQCAAKRPISLICALSKALGATVLNRIQPGVEQTWGKEQYAHRRDGGVELHLAAPHTEKQEHPNERRFARLSSLDISAAFDEVPRDLLFTSLQQK